ncbi:TetR family transcriptional regulator [Pseudomonas alcaligenes]|uniref:TetR family transcriptional regulator n=1 Tax=Aquipseudomonas alcaligenes TaxID=43263 RepID=A0ABR7S335_AQUAC|nr:TetR family transcriptional regulator [Pseudomonas alcaligenes]MBC9251967.1 TetR family transcriptional regulator [Pseudomonas alcaligenes]
MTLSTALACPARLASELADSVQYQGRKASRQGSEQRRLSILDASLRIIARDGLRGVRHRAVAAEAGVPLSATTYYFKDIQDLITDSFVLFVERSSANLSLLWADIAEDFQRMASQVEQAPEARRQMAGRVIDLSVAHIQTKAREGDTELLVELAFRQAALTNPALMPLAQAHQQLRLQFAELALRALGSAAPVEDAQVLTTLVLRMEYHALVDGVENLDIEGQRAVLQRFLDLVIGV